MDNFSILCYASWQSRDSKTMTQGEMFHSCRKRYHEAKAHKSPLGHSFASFLAP